MFGLFIICLLWACLAPLVVAPFAIWAAYDRKGYYRILENNRWDNIQYFTIAFGISFGPFATFLLYAIFGGFE